MEIWDYLQVAANYGIAAVLLFAVLRWLRDHLDRLFDALFARLDNRASSKEIIDIDRTVIDALWKLLAELDAHRAYVFLLHNGMKSCSGLSFMRVSCTHEVVASGVLSQQMRLQNIPATLVINFIDELQKRGYILCPSVDECYKGKDPGIYALLEEQEIKSIYCHAITSDDGNLCGFIGVDYIHEHVLDDLKVLGSYAAKIGALLCVQNCVLGGKK